MEIRLFTIESNPKQIHHYFAFEAARDKFYNELKTAKNSTNTTHNTPILTHNSQLTTQNSIFRLNKSHIDIKIEDTKTLNDIIEL